ncbi:MAG: hypothetical protein MI923_20135 [Phycisphaerales bacterium]|nr:hypothetical protein [Phycisphaerales bacterium]
MSSVGWTATPSWSASHDAIRDRDQLKSWHCGRFGESRADSTAPLPGARLILSVC